MKHIPIILAVSLIITHFGCSGGADETKDSPFTSPLVKLENQEQKSSYAMGYNMGKNLKRIYKNLDSRSLMQGVFDGFTGDPTLMEEEEIKESLSSLQRNLQRQQTPEQAAQAKANIEAGQKYLADNAQKPGVKTTSSGLQYEVLTEGKGAVPEPNDRVRVHYQGNLIDGREFDSSHKRGKPAEFALKQVIPGWTEALQLMRVGAKYRFVIPANLAYGERQAGPLITPNSTLIFEIELLDIIGNDNPN